MKAVLYRHTRRRAVNATLGVLTFLGEATHDPIHTLEPPWHNNEMNRSCIPCGEYRVIPHDGPKFKDCWEIEDVPGRTAILFHAGNTVLDTHGCVLVGMFSNFLIERRAVLQSRVALDLMRTLVGSERGFMLRVTDCEASA